LLAASIGDEAMVRLLLQQGDINPDARGQNGDTSLICASQKGHIGVVRVLLDWQDVDPNLKEETGWTPLMIAANKGHEAVVQLLLEEEDVSVKSREKALRLAARAGNESVVELFKKKPLKNLGLQHPPEKHPSSGIHLDTSGRFIQTTKKSMFNERKHKLAYDFLRELDDKVAGGQIASITASAGGVKVVWNKKFRKTAGRANWKKEKITKLVTSQSSSQSVTYRHIASIELSEKVIDDEGMCTSMFRERD
jgi:hypothetical protein